MNKKRIAVIGLKGLPAFGGAATVGENIIEQLKEKYDFTVLSTSSHTSHRSGCLSGYYQKVFRKIPLRKLNSFYYYIRSAIFVLFKNYDLVHLHHRDAAFLTVFLKWKQPVILTTHGIFSINDEWKKYHFYFRIQEKYFVKKASYITCVSLNEKRLFEKKLGLCVHYIPNGINPTTSLQKKTENTSKTILFAAGRIIYLKGCDILIKALLKINYKGKLLIAGNLDIDNKVKNEILKLAEGINCEFLGLIKDREILNSFIQNADLFVFPSRRETMSMMLLEVASFRTPLIASDIVQNKDVFCEDEVIYFDSENVEDLSDKITWALNNGNKLKSFTDKAYLKLFNNYSWKNISEEYSSVYERFFKSN